MNFSRKKEELGLVTERNVLQFTYKEMRKNMGYDFFHF